MAPFMDLPTELTDAIFANCDQRGLIGILLSCKSLSPRALPRLYRSIHLTWTKDHTADPPLHLLLKSVLSDPTKGLHIEHIDFQATGYRNRHKSPSKPTKGPTLELKDLEKAYQAIETTGLPAAETWREAIAEGNIDASIALLLTQLPNLRTLALGLDLQKDNAFLGPALIHILRAHPSTQISRLANLEYVNLSAKIDGNAHWHFAAQLDIEQFLPFFYLPVLKSADMLLPDIRDRPNRDRRQVRLTWPLPRTCDATALVSLRLQRTRASAAMLKSITAIAPNIRTLEYHYLCKCGYTLETGDLKAALRHIGRTLENLTVAFIPYTAEAESVEEHGDECINGALGSLKEFHALEALEISPTVLLGWEFDGSAELTDTLPAGLRTIRFRDDCTDFEGWNWTEDNCMLKFAPFLESGWRAATPCLESFNMRLAQSFDEWQAPGQEKLLRVCEEQGLKCEITKLHTDIYGEVM